MIKKAASMMAVIAMLAGMTATAQAENADARISKTAYAACEEAGAKYCISPEFLMAVIEAESGGEQYATNGGCMGLMQIYAKYHSKRMAKLGVYDIYDERGNVLVGADYLAELFGEYEDAALVLDFYHGDSSAMWNAQNGVISDYAEGILERSAELERIHGK